MSTLFNLIGWVGATILIATYFAITTEKLSSKDKSYQILNLLAGALLGISSFYFKVYFAVAINSFWFLIAILGYLKGRISS